MAVSQIDVFRDQYAFLSNFYFRTLHWEQIDYPTLEHAFQAAKSLDMAERLRLSQITSPMDVKKAGQALAPLRPKWKKPVRLEVMRELVTVKFAAATDLAEKLCETDGQVLVEGNTWHDNFWGNCVCGRMPRCAEPGQNQLGLALMWRRAHLKGRI